MNDSDEENLKARRAIFVGDSLEDAKLFVQQNLRTGCICPTCGQLAKVYRRTLHATMAHALCLIYCYFREHPEHTWLHIPEFLVRMKGNSTVAGGDVAKLRYWGVIERASGHRADGNDKLGRYSITETGRSFVEGKIAVPRYVYIHNQLLLNLSEETVTIQQALGQRFNYADLIKPL